MSDPYRPDYYQQPSHHAPYNPSTYVPPSDMSGALAPRRSSNQDDSDYYPSQSNMQLSQSSYRPPAENSDYLSPDDRPRSHHRHHKSSRSHSRHRDDRDDRDDRYDRDDRDNDRSERSGRNRSHSRTKEWGATAVGGAAGALLGKELGHGKLGTIGGLVAGAVGAHELEKRHERKKEQRRLEDAYPHAARDGDGHHRRRSSGSFVDNIQDKVTKFVNPDKEGGKRSKSHVGGSRGYEDYDDYDDDEKYSRRSSRDGGRKKRDDYY